MNSKNCPMCKQEKLFELFSKNSRRKDGCSYECKVCNKKRVKDWIEKNRIHRCLYKKIYFQTHKDEIAKTIKHKRQTILYIKIRDYLRNRLYSALSKNIKKWISCKRSGLHYRGTACSLREAVSTWYDLGELEQGWLAHRS